MSFKEKGDDLTFEEMLDASEKEWNEQKILRDFNRSLRKTKRKRGRVKTYSLKKRNIS